MKKQIIFLLCCLMASLMGYAQSIKVSGIVTDKDGEPLIGATVLAVGTQTGIATDIDGKYSLSVSPKARLSFSYVGYETRVIDVNNRTEINVTLEPSYNTLDEVVAIGYGVVKKSDLTSSISTVKGDKITEVTTGNAMDALQGKVNGVQVASGGGPGTSPKVIIRGITTVNGSNPLYVVDGMPVGDNINYLNNNDIESMEVLKDASAAAIYGTRGSNGVILITTKKGAQGKTNVSFSASAGFQTLKKPNMAGAEEYEKVYKARYTNDDRTAVWNTPSTLNYAGTDWWDETVNSTALIQNYALGVTGGTDKLVYSFSAGYFRNNSQYDYGYWDKINVRLNTEYTFCKQVQFGLDMAPTMESWDDTPSQLESAMAMDPTTPIYKNNDESQGYARSYNNQTWNPVASISRMDSHSRKIHFLLNPYLVIKPIDQLTFRSQFGSKYTLQRSDGYTPEFYIDALEQSQQSSVSRTMNEYFDWSWNNTLTWMQTFNKKHNLTVMAGFTAERYAQYYLSASRSDIPNDNELLREVSAGTSNQQGSGNTYYNTLVSYLGRVMYNYDHRYYLTASLRSDGSSRFPAGNKYATFPSVSVAWRATQEEFMKDVDWLNDLKIRFGWGKVGNQAIGNSDYISTMTTSDYVFNGTRYSGVVVGSLGNTQLRWETVEDIDVGFDAQVLNNRLAFSFDWYRKTSHDMLYSKQNPNFAGYPNWNSAVMTNIGSMRAEGWEVSINWRDRTGDFSYDLGVQVSGVRNRAIKFTGDGAIYDGSGMNESITKNEDGQLIGRFFGYKTAGIFQNWTEVYAHSDEHGNLIQPNAQPGDLIFVDVNGDGQLTEDDKCYIGNPYPDVMLGLNMSFGWKNWDLTANFYGTLGNDIFNLTKALNSGTNGGNVYAGAYDNAWRTDNTNASLPRLSVNDLNENYTKVSDFYVEDGSYFRCKLLTLGYTLPRNITGTTSLRFYFSAQNPFTITKYSGFDPERPMLDGGVLATGIDRYGYPNPRTFLFGLDFKF